jgi:hypothetical protein
VLTFLHQTTSWKSRISRGMTSRRCSTTRVRVVTASRSLGYVRLLPRMPRRGEQRLLRRRTLLFPHCTILLTIEYVPQSQLAKGEEVATCPSCSLLVRVVYDMVCLLFLQIPPRMLTLPSADGLRGLRGRGGNDDLGALRHSLRGTQTCSRGEVNRLASWVAEKVLELVVDSR